MKTREQFWRHVLVAKPDDCWEWMGGSQPAGYGVVTFQGKVKATHRLVMEWRHERELRRDEVVRHACDNPGCVNPAHLRVGTAAENAADRDARGRGIKGRPTPRLSSERRAELKAKHLAGRSMLSLSREYGIAWETVKRAIRAE